MPLLLLFGQPFTGKSTLAARLADAARGRGVDTFVLDTDSMSVDRRDYFRTIGVVRAKIRQQVAQFLSPDRLVIVDHTNHTKSFRYELYCLARERRTTNCIVSTHDPAIDDATVRQKHAQSAAHTAGPNPWDPRHYADICSRFECLLKGTKTDEPVFSLPVFAAHGAGGACSAGGSVGDGVSASFQDNHELFADGALVTAFCNSVIDYLVNGPAARRNHKTKQPAGASERRGGLLDAPEAGGATRADGPALHCAEDRDARRINALLSAYIATIALTQSMCSNSGGRVQLQGEVYHDLPTHRLSQSTLLLAKNSFLAHTLSCGGSDPSFHGPDDLARRFSAFLQEFY